MVDDPRLLELVAPLAQIETNVATLLAREDAPGRLELEEIRDAAEKMERVLEALAEAQPDTSLSHDLRGPLTALGLQLERLKRDKAHPLGVQQELAVRKAATAVKRLTGVVESALHIPVAGSVEARPTPEFKV